MALIHLPPARSTRPGDGTAPADEIIDLTDRRRVLLHAIFGVSVDSDTADAVFAPVEVPSLAVEDDTFTVES